MIFLICVTSMYTSPTLQTSEEIKININEDYVRKDFLFTWGAKDDGTLDVSITSYGKEGINKLPTRTYN